MNVAAVISIVNGVLGLLGTSDGDVRRIHALPCDEDSRQRILVAYTTLTEAREKARSGAAEFRFERTWRYVESNEQRLHETYSGRMWWRGSKYKMLLTHPKAAVGANMFAATVRNDAMSFFVSGEPKAPFGGMIFDVRPPGLDPSYLLFENGPRYTIPDPLVLIGGFAAVFWTSDEIKELSTAEDENGYRADVGFTSGGRTTYQFGKTCDFLPTGLKMFYLYKGKLVLGVEITLAWKEHGRNWFPAEYLYVEHLLGNSERRSTRETRVEILEATPGVVVLDSEFTLSSLKLPNGIRGFDKRVRPSVTKALEDGNLIETRHSKKKAPFKANGAEFEDTQSTGRNQREEATIDSRLESRSRIRATGIVFAVVGACFSILAVRRWWKRRPVAGSRTWSAR